METNGTGLYYSAVPELAYRNKSVGVRIYGTGFETGTSGMLNFVACCYALNSVNLFSLNFHKSNCQFVSITLNCFCVALLETRRFARFAVLNVHIVTGSEVLLEMLVVTQLMKQEFLRILWGLIFHYHTNKISPIDPHPNHISQFTYYRRCF